MGIGVQATRGHRQHEHWFAANLDRDAEVALSSTRDLVEPSERSLRAASFSDKPLNNDPLDNTLSIRGTCNITGTMKR
jgi:hypothetical protein